MRFMTAKMYLLMLATFTSVANADVCDRSEAMILMLEANLNKNCRDITESDLAKVKFISLTCATMKEPRYALKRGDFHGLVNLEGLKYNNCMTHGPAKLFEGVGPQFKFLNLEGHTHLNLIAKEILRSGFKSLDPEFLAGLSNLTYISMKNNQLLEIPPGLFDEVVNLKDVNFEMNLLTTLPENLFINQKNLEYVGFISNQMEVLPNSLMSPDGVRPQWINFMYNKIQIVPEGLFKSNPPEELVLSGNELSEADQSRFLSEYKDVVIDLSVGKWSCHRGHCRYYGYR